MTWLSLFWPLYTSWLIFVQEKACEDSDKEDESDSSLDQEKEEEYTQQQNQQKAMIEKEKV